MPSLKELNLASLSDMINSYKCSSSPGGCLCHRSSPEEVEQRNRSKRIDRELKTDQRRMQRQVKLLLLGAGESGKSTFLKQMKIIHGVVFEPEQIREFRQIIYHNMIRGMRVLVDANNKLNIGMEKEQNKVIGERLLAFDKVSEVNETNFSDFKSILNLLWQDRGIQETFSRRSAFQITDSLEYFYQNLDRVADAKYVPTQQDILYCRKTTKGIIEFPLMVENVPFLFVDVGGQRTQRQKWFQCFDSVTAILFLASSSEFDQVLLEDKTTNRLQEARSIFDTIVNNRIFHAVSFILFLNKMDLLQEKVEVKKLDISDKFKEEFTNKAKVKQYVEKFNGDPFNLNDVKNFILYLFVSKQRDSAKPLYHHFTTAVDTRNIEYVFSSVKETILRKNLDALMLQ